MSRYLLQPGYLFDQDIETMPRLRILRQQLEKLKATLAHAHAKVPHYQHTFAQAGVAPEDLTSLEDLARFPFTTKDDLRAAYPFGLFAVPQREIIRFHASSGTTGKPTVVGYTRADIETWAGLMARSLVCGGVRPGDVLHNAYGYGLFTGGLGVHYGGEKLGCAVTPASGGGTERQIELLRDFGARALCATPSYAINIAEVAEREGVELRNGALSLGIFGGEPWSEGMRKELDDRLGIKSVDLYGLSEVMGPGVAAECVECRNGLHGWEDCFVFEIIDPATGTPLPMGEVGELVITTLAKWGQPLIRYRTRDITRLEDEPCPCGRHQVRIMRITGRNDDMLIIRGVNVYPSQVEAALMGLPRLEPHYQLVIRRDGPLDTLTIEVEAAVGVQASDYTALAGSVEHHIKSLIGVTSRCIVLPPGQVPRSQGKAARVRDLRDKD